MNSRKIQRIIATKMTNQFSTKEGGAGNASFDIKPEPTCVPVPSLIRFFVPGIPKTAGSKRAIPIFARKGDKSSWRGNVVVDDNKKGKDWRGDIQAVAKRAYDGDPILGPLKLELTFVMPRPGYHFGTKGLKPNAPFWPQVKPDVIKLARAVEDALTGILWRDDAQICQEPLQKHYGEKPGVLVELTPLGSVERQPEGQPKLL